MPQNYILVHKGTATPVPLPFHTTDFRGDPTTVTDFYMPPGRGESDNSSGRIVTDSGTFYPSVCNLELITEAEFMRRGLAQHEQGQ